MNKEKKQITTQTKTGLKTALVLGIISATCVAIALLSMVISTGQKLFLMLK